MSMTAFDVDDFISQQNKVSLDALNGTNLFLFWAGSTTLPTMYEVALWTTVKAYGRDNVTIVSQTLSDGKDWYPQIHNISLYDIAQHLTDIHPYPVWETFLQKVYASGVMAHQSDFFRIAIIYIFGGFYADFDSLWIRPVPMQLPNQRNRSMFRVSQYFDPDTFTNGFLGSMPRQPFYRLVLENMHLKYYAPAWTCIGSKLLDYVYNEWNHTHMKLFENVSEDAMYGVRWRNASDFFEMPLQYVEDDTLDFYINTTGLTEEERVDNMVDYIFHKSYQIHLYGKMTEVAKGKIPCRDSLYDRILSKLDIDVLKWANSSDF